MLWKKCEKIKALRQHIHIWLFPFFGSILLLMAPQTCCPVAGGGWWGGGGGSPSCHGGVYVHPNAVRWCDGESWLQAPDSPVTGQPRVGDRCQGGHNNCNSSVLATAVKVGATFSTAACWRPLSRWTQHLQQQRVGDRCQGGRNNCNKQIMKILFNTVVHYRYDFRICQKLFVW